MTIADIRINHISKPFGFMLGQEPVVTFKVVDVKGTAVERIVIQVAEDEAFSAVLYSNTVNKLQAGYPLMVSLTPRKRYYVRVSVRSDCQEEAEGFTWFETGKCDEPWQAKWIGSENAEPAVPTLRKKIYLTKQVVSARAYVGCAGIYAFSVNGEKVGEEYLTPYCNDYQSWQQVITHDLTEAIKVGGNTLDFTLSDGWYKGSFTYERVANIYGSRLALIAEIHLIYKDGAEEVIGTDSTWDVLDSVYDSAGIYDGVVMNYVKKVAKYGTAGELNMHSAKLCDRLSLPVKVNEKLSVQKCFITPKGELCLDLGQNMTGWLRIDTSSFVDKSFRLRYFEVLDKDGNVYTENLRSAQAAFTYISDGRVRVVEPEFTFYGFRYVWVEGLENVTADAFTGCVVYSELSQCGWIETSNQLVNKLFSNTLWSQKGNFLDIPSDCPQRDERLGWTGDAQIFSGTAYYNMDVTAFFAKYIYDMRKEQDKMGGAVPVVVPTFSTGHSSTQMLSGSVAGWGDAATVIPWTTYLHTGDKRLLANQYSNMRDWVEYIRTRGSVNHIWDADFQLGDWLSLDNPDANSKFGMTPTPLVATAFYLYSTTLTAKAARALGYAEDEKEYEALADRIREALQHEYVTPSGLIASDTQTADVLALYMRFYRDKQTTVSSLAKKIEMSYGGHLSTGFLGTGYLCKVLSENGCNNLAYKLLLRKEYPGWLYEVEQGATTIWERWNSINPNGSFGPADMNSMNHYSYGAVIEWMYQYAAGLQTDEDYPGFSQLRYSPHPNPRLEWLKARYDSCMGTYTSAWKIQEDGLRLAIEIPFGAVALLHLPDAPQEITLNGKATVYAEGMKLVSGRYTIFYQPMVPYYLEYSMETKLSTVLDHSALVGGLIQLIPAVVQISPIILYSFKGSVKELLQQAGIPVDVTTENQINETWKSIRSWDR